ncbi:MAG: acyl-ACP--UDP-N-acetylglucosamine O-acyltransferase [Phycisphaerales bacterium]|nr:acyl-ACP--UDP-N-acetylglucosamine O-acyltransferase [Phycisphaerales bacterium]
MANVDPSSRIGPDVELADDVEIGPGCVFTGRITIGPGTRFIGTAYVQGPAEIGAGNLIYPFVSLGFTSQYRGRPIDAPTGGIRIGDDNILRESFTIHRSIDETQPTSIGNDNYMMISSHVGHDGQVGNHNTFVNSAQIGGHVVVEDRCMLGGLSGIHQFCRIGKLAMLGGSAITTTDVPPFMTIVGRNGVSGPNVVGLRRAGYSQAEIDNVRWAHRVIFRLGWTRQAILERLDERADQSEAIRDLVQFIRNVKRGLPSARDRSAKRRD